MYVGNMVGNTEEKAEVTNLTEDIVEDISIETIKLADEAAGEAEASEIKGEADSENKAEQPEKKVKRRISLQVKLNVFLTIIVLIVSMQLLNINYHSYKEETKERIEEKLDAAESTNQELNDSMIEETTYLYWVTQLDGFKEVREDAVAKGNIDLLEEWCNDNYVIDYHKGTLMTVEEHEEFRAALREEAASLGYSEDEYYDYFEENDKGYYDYYEIGTAVFSASVSMTGMADYAGLSYVAGYAEVPDGYLLVMQGYEMSHDDLSFSEFNYLGDHYDNVEAIKQYKKKKGDNHVTVQEGKTTEAVKVVPYEKDGVQYYFIYAYDATDEIEAQQAFLKRSLIFVAIMVVVAIVISILIMRRMVTKPLKSLAKAVDGFSLEEDEEGSSEIIDLPIKSRDEIGTLYDNIRSMQTRIIDDSENITQMTAERERLGFELELAEKIQKSTLPNKFPAFPEHPEFDIYASMDPAKEIGGDFYDYYMIDDKHLAVVIADVSGKGVPAALFMMVSKIFIMNNAMAEPSPAEVLKKANHQISSNNPEGMFVSVWLGILDITTGKMVCTNAGHEYPVIKEPEGSFKIFKEEHGLVLGLVKDFEYSEYELQLSPGSKIFVYTDGVAEASTADKKMFGMGRIENALNECSGGTPEEILHHVRESVDGFVGDAEQFDDLTMLCLEYKGTVG